MANSIFMKINAIDPKHVIYSSLVLTGAEVTRAIGFHLSLSNMV